MDAILSLVRGGRPESADDETVRRHVAWGPGPRAAQALMLASRARALLDGRLAPSIDDVVALARPVLRHRMALNFSARADGVVLADVIDRLVAHLPSGSVQAAADARRAEALGARLPPLLVAAERVAATVAQGVHGRRRVGQGDSFWQFRRFVAGDPIARIDWRQSAKSGRPVPDGWFIRETEWEAAQTICLWRDASASMRWRSRGGRSRSRVAPRCCCWRSPRCCYAAENG